MRLNFNRFFFLSLSSFKEELFILTIETKYKFDLIFLDEKRSNFRAYKRFRFCVVE